jgi:uncharacterized OB-fold protein
MRGVPPPELVRITRDDWTAPFWAATAEHRLVIPRCGDCGTHRLPPGPFCFVCRSQAVEWDDHDGSGTIYTFTVVRHPVIPDMADHLPVIGAVVALDGLDGIRLVGDVVDAEPEQVTVGAPVTIDWYDVRDGDTVPVFRLRG